MTGALKNGISDRIPHSSLNWKYTDVTTFLIIQALIVFHHRGQSYYISSHIIIIIPLRNLLSSPESTVLNYGVRKNKTPALAYRYITPPPPPSVGIINTNYLNKFTKRYQKISKSIVIHSNINLNFNALRIIIQNYIYLNLNI